MVLKNQSIKTIWFNLQFHFINKNIIKNNNNNKIRSNTKLMVMDLSKKKK